MTPDLPPVLAIDGPGGSGKGTAGQLLAGRLGWHFLDSGALYRILAVAVQERGMDINDISTIAALAEALDVSFDPEAGGEARILLAGRDVSDVIRDERIGMLASQLAALPAVRRALLHKQQVLRRFPGLVADGRDMGTHVFKDAVLKVFLTASPEVRAQRRYNQLKEKGFDVNLARLVQEIRARDERDISRPVSPLRPASDAVVLDTSSLSVSAVVERIWELLQEKLGN